MIGGCSDIGRERALAVGRILCVMGCVNSAISFEGNCGTGYGFCGSWDGARKGRDMPPWILSYWSQC